MSYFGNFNEKFALIDDAGVILTATQFNTLSYSSGVFEVGQTVEGTTSGATGLIVFFNGSIIVLQDIVGAFVTEVISNQENGATFTLTDHTDTTAVGGLLFILEPENFSDQEFSLPRSSKYFGFISEFANAEEATLLFDKLDFVAGGTSPFGFIKELQDTAGFDAKLSLRAYRTPLGGVETYKEWKIALSSAEQLDYAFVCRVKRVWFNDKLRTRWDTDINVEASENLDSVADTALTLIDLPLHSKIINQRVAAETGTVAVIQDSNTTESYNALITGYFGGPTRNEIESFDPLYNLNHGDVAALELPMLIEKVKFSGVFELSYVGEASWYLIPGFASTYTADLSLVVKVYNGDDLISTDTLHTESVSSGGAFHLVGGNFTSSIDLNLSKGQSVYLYYQITYVNTSITLTVTSTFEHQFPEIAILFKTTHPASMTEGAFIYEMLNKLIQKAIGDESYDPLQSTLLERVEQGAGSDGDGSLNFLTIGSKIRNLDRSLIINISKIMDFVRARYCAGFALIQDGVNTKVLVERADHFFKDVEILDIGIAYEELVVKNNETLIFNELEFGFEKYGEAKEDGTIEGVNTKRGYLMPVESVKAEFSATTNIVADDTEIERMRRIDPTKYQADNSDEDPFVVQCRRFNAAYRVTSDEANTERQYIVINATADTIRLQGYYLEGALASLTEITIGVSLTAGPLTETTYTIFSIAYSAGGNYTTITTVENITTSNTYPYFAFHFDADILIPERVEGFTAITGLDDPYSSYNLRHWPSEFLMEWFSYLGGVINEKDGADKIKFTTRRNNVDVAKKGGTYSGTDTITESQDFALSLVRGYNPTYLNRKYYEATLNLSYDSELVPLLEALAGEFGASKDWGYISGIDNEGEAFKFYPDLVVYRTNNSSVKLSGYGKKV